MFFFIIYQNILDGAPQTPSLFTIYSTENQQLRIDKQNVQQQLEQLETNFDHLREDNDCLRADNQLLQREINALKQQMRELVHEVLVLRGQPPLYYGKMIMRFWMAKK